MENELNKGALHEKWVKDYLSGKINAASFAVLIIIEPYIEQLNQLELKADTGLVIEMISSKHLTPKEEQQVKEKLKEISRIFSDSDSSNDEKQQDASKVKDDMENILHLIVGFLTA